MEVAALGLRVDGADGIERARDALGGFTKASEGAERSTEKLGKGGRKAAEGISEVDKAAAKASKSLAAMYTDAMRTAKGLVGLFALRQLQQFADGWSDLQSQVGAATGDMDGAADSMQRLTDMANASYSPLQQTVGVYARNVATFRDLGRSASEAADFTEAVNHALVTTATRGQDADVMIGSLSRSLATGRLDAQAFDTIVSRSPRILKAMADQMGVTTSELRKLAVEGKVTSDVIATGMVSSLSRLSEEAALMPATLTDAFVRVQNNLTEFVGKIDKASGASGALAEAVLGFADGIRMAGDYVLAFGALVGPAFDVAGSALLAVAKYADIAAIALAGFYSPALIGGLAVLTKSLAGGVVGGIKAVTAAIAANPIGAIVAVLAAAGYAMYSAFSEAKSGADALARTVEDLRSPLSSVVESFNKLSKDQQAGKLVEYTEALGEAVKVADGEFAKLISTLNSNVMAQAGVPRSEIEALVSQLKEAKASGEALSPILNDFATRFGIPRSALDSWVKLAKSFDEAKSKAEGVKEGLNAVNQSLSILSSSSNSFAAGIEKWDEYLKKLTDARDVIGMSARQLGVFEAAQAGANSVQREMAGVITAQTDAYKKLQTAIEGKDKKAAEAAKNNIRALDVERQKVELLAIKTQALIAATNAFARGEVSGDVASGILQNMLAGFAQAEAAIKVSKEAEAQITNIYANAVPKKDTGGSSRSDELKNVIKQLTLQKGALGMTAEQAARYEIEMAKGSETDRKRALTLYDQIQAWNETEKAMQAAIDSSRQYLAFQQEMDVFQQKLNLESAGVGMGDRQRELAQADLAIRQEYAQKRLDLEMAQQVKETALTQEQYQYRLDLFQQFEEQKLAGLQQSAEARAIAEADWTNGMSRAWDNFATKAQDIAGQTEAIFTGMLNSFSSGFGNAFEKMIFDSENLGDAMRNVAQGMARAVVNALAQMAAQWLAYQAVQLIVGKTTQASSAMAMSANAYATALQAGLAAFASTAAIPVVGPAAAPAAMGAALAVATPLATAVSMTAMAGMAHDGIDSVPQTGTWLLEKGERVTTAKTSARLDSVLERIDARQRAGRAFDGQAGSSSKSEPRVVVQLMGSEFQGAQVTEERGSTDEELIVRVVSRDFLQGGRTFDALQSVSNVRRVGA
ncbi:tape measure protein [Alcaligenes sp. SORT26]|uniref:tape measure protein n=1 Tax=Alcaligenes sp. SORT26 TaxID=2813780 RepID=UPI001A9F92C0|nr:tape measure protein [Alcaligenes sp. SORT26]QTC00519.1 tape measure protein [Alcaligenes sp. SORT26]